MKFALKFDNLKIDLKRRAFSIIRIVLFSVLGWGISFSIQSQADSFASESQLPNPGPYEQLCDHLVILGSVQPAWTPVEKRLICGDPQSEAWKSIPYSQKKYNIRNFLQERGYLHPLFVPPQVHDREIKVIVGWQTYLTDVQVIGANGIVDIHRKRDLLGKPLTPSILGAIEKWVTQQLQSSGYACPQVSSQANSSTGEVRVFVETGEVQNVLDVTTDSLSDMDSRAFRRYDAFDLNRPFNSNLLTVTSNRILQFRIVESTHFTSRCDSEGVHLFQDMVPGPPRLLTLGGGLSSEGVILAKATWRNARLGKMGSLLDFTATGSSQIQSLNATLNWYFLPHVSRYYLSPFVQLLHRNEINYEYISSTARFGISRTTDEGNVGTILFFGPKLDLYRTLRGVGQQNSKLVSLSGSVLLKSHAFEYYTQNPQAGFTLFSSLDLNNNHFFSDFNAQRISVRGEALWNFKNYDSPLWVIGLRGGFATLITQLDPTQGVLPPSLLQYLGGSIDIRGFSRQELPGPVGGISSFFLGSEARLTQVLPLGLDPFLFVDVGAIGSQGVSFDSPLYWSPGLGVRWGSPIGPFRMTIAHGYQNLDPAHWQFFFSLGEEF